MNKNVIAICIGLVVIVVAAAFVLGGNSNNEATPSQEVVSIVDGKQIIDIRAKGGFNPRKIVAKAGVPTTLRVTTKATFDCSSSIRIPSLNVSQNLQPTGVSEIELGVQSVGTLQGSCGMGMYPFEIEFQ